MKLAINDIIQVYGWCMLENLSEGRYRVSRIISHGNNKGYCFTKPNGKKVIVSHYAKNVDAWVRDGSCDDLNKIVKV
jgi:hypothetical protein